MAFRQGAALAAARGRCETLNHVGLDDDGGNVVHVTASTLADVGEARPELVARLRAARVRWTDPGAPPPLPFPSLDTIVVVSTVQNPSYEEAQDPRVVLADVVLTQDACERVARFARPPWKLHINFNHTVIEGIERARDAGLRVERVSLQGWVSREDEARLAAAVAPLAMRALTCRSLLPSSVLLVQHARDTVRDLQMSACDGFFVALEARLRGSSRGFALTLTRESYAGLPEADVAAMERLVARGAVSSLALCATHCYSLDAAAWARILAASTPALRTLDMGTLHFKDALSVFSAAVPRAADLRLALYQNGMPNDAAACAAAFRALGAALAGARDLRRLCINTYVTAAADAKAFPALVEELTSGNPGLERVAVGHGIWTREGGCFRPYDYFYLY